MNKSEILYRGKRIDNGEWVEGLPSYDMNGNLEEMEVYKGFCNCNTYEIDPRTVCRYTGLTDKNGRKIFEGDIIKHFNDERHPEKFTTVVVKWDEDRCAFVLQESLGMKWRIFSRYSRDYEVIGNIFDNPELLDSGGNPE